MALRVSKVTIRNILGVEDLEFEPGKLTVVKGQNGTGKTSVLEAIRAALRGGNDATLVRRGAIEGEVVLVLDDGVEIDKRINDKSSSVTVRTPGYGKVSKPQTVIDALLNQLSINPIDLLTAPAGKQKEAFLKAMPLTVTRDQVLNATGLVYNWGNFYRHGLEVLDDFHKELYDQRTGVNRALKEKQATAKTLAESLPEQPPEGDWQTQHESLADQLNDLDYEHMTRSQGIESGKQHAIGQIRDEMAARINELKQQAQAGIDAIKTRLAEDCEALQGEHAATCEQIHGYADASQEALEGEIAPKRERLLELKQHARTMVEISMKAKSARQLVDQMQLDYDRLTTESKDLSRAMEGLAQLKEQLVKDLPIAGLEVRDGQLYLHDIPVARWNEAVRVQLAMDLAKLSAGRLGLIVVDGLERLDKRTFEALANYIIADDSGCQYVVSRVTEDTELTIETH